MSIKGPYMAPSNEFNDFDINKTIAEFMTQNLARFESGIANFIGSASLSAKHLVAGKYKTYLESAANKYLSVRTFFHRDNPIRLYDVYVPLDIAPKVGGGRLGESIPANMTYLGNVKFATIVGSGGSGKTTIMRYLFLDALLRTNKVPVFIELRDLSGSSVDFETEIIKTMQAAGLDYEHTFLKSRITAGDFLFLLDGFDELEPGIQKDVATQIGVFQSRYSKNSLIVSSRPDHKLTEWEFAACYYVVPLTLQKAVDLVARIPFDETVIKAFSDALIDRLFEKHESFLSNPLLLTIMLLTYSEHADIPNQVTDFYNQAYEALFQKHDANKGVFTRIRNTDLNMQQFRHAFAAFSLMTYNKTKISFSRIFALETIEKVKRVTKLEFTEEDFLKDCLQSVCLLVEDGQLITYTHRSMQEYFAAVFVHQHLDPSKVEAVAARYRSRAFRDSFFTLLREINPRLVDLKVVVPFIERLAEQTGYEDKVTKEVHLNVLRVMVSEVIVDSDSNISAFTIGQEFDYQFLLFIFHEYQLSFGTGLPRDEVGEEAEEIKIEQIDVTHPVFEKLWTVDGGVVSKKFISGFFGLKADLVREWGESDSTLEETLLD
ncbi:hypothetical protein N9L06_04375 [Mariniblastus sp.]|nr:hypothetical protein [Mariniblastus sp.]